MKLIAAFVGWLVLVLAVIAGPLPGRNVRLSAGPAAVAGDSALFSTRLVNPAYTGKALQVHRSSDSATQDIGFVTGDLDTGAMLAFCTGDCAVSIWYDQSGNARNLMSSGGPLPGIVSAGSITKTMNGHACVNFVPGTHQSLSAGSAFPIITTTTGTVLAVGHAVTGGSASTGVANRDMVVDFAANGFGLSFAQSVFTGAPAFIAWRVTAGGERTASTSYTFATDGIFGWRLNTSDLTPFKGYVNGGMPGTDTNVDPTTVATEEIALAWNGAGPTTADFDGWECEIRFFNTELSVADTNIVGNGMATFWGPAWTDITQ